MDTSDTNTTPQPAAPQKTVVLELSFHKFGNSKKLPKEAIQVDADPDMISGNKKLLKVEKELQALYDLQRGLAEWVKARSIPAFFRPGLHLVSLSVVTVAVDKIKAAQLEQQALVRRLQESWETYLEDAKERLRSQFNPLQYPTREALPRVFGIDYRLLAFRAPTALQDVSQGLFEEEYHKHIQGMVETLEYGQVLLREGFAELVDDMVHCLTPDPDGKRKVLRQAKVEKLQEFLATFRDRNFTNDTALLDKVAECEQLMRGVDAQRLRTNMDLRAQVADGFATLKHELKSMIEPRKKRAIFFDDDEKAAA
jgi:hypothetical protein